MSEAPLPVDACPACQATPLPQAIFCHSCGNRLGPDYLGPLRLLLMFLVVNVIAGLGALGTCLCITGVGMLAGLPLILLCALSLKLLGDRLR